MEVVTDVRDSTIKELKKKFGYWFYVALGAGVLFSGYVVLRAIVPIIYSDDPLSLISPAIEDSIFLLLGPWMFFVIIYGLFRIKVIEKFWIDFASEKGFTYQKTGDVSLEKGLMFRQGDFRAITNLVQGTEDSVPVSFFNYRFDIGSGKNRKIYEYVVFEFKTTGTFPNLVLNYTKGRFRLSKGKPLEVPGLQGLYEVFVPEQYEIEALQIFTPDILALLTDLEIASDIEFCDGEILIYTEGMVASRAELDMRYTRARTFVQKLYPILSTMRLTPIGDYSAVL
jgi:hypothetical protein